MRLQATPLTEIHDEGVETVPGGRGDHQQRLVYEATHGQCWRPGQPSEQGPVGKRDGARIHVNDYTLQQMHTRQRLHVG